jgi:hypothetical protein
MPITPAMTIGMTFFITELGCRIPVCIILTPDLYVPICKWSERGVKGESVRGDYR